MNILDITIIGVGRLGGSLALALSKNGYQIRELVSKNRKKAEEIAQLIDPQPVIYSEKELEKISSSIIFITTPDDQIEIVSEELAEKLENLPFVFHTSGSRSSKSLSRLNDEGFEVASFHPLASFSEPVSGADNFKDSFICIEGDSEAILIAEQIAKDLGGKPFSIKSDYKILYHAAAVTACGHLVALLSSSIEMLTKCGLDKHQAQEILLPLVNSTVKNLESQPPAKALTGTFARADAETLIAHLNILRESMPEEILKIYLLLGYKSLELAKENGVDEKAIERMKEILEVNYQVCA